VNYKVINRKKKVALAAGDFVGSLLWAPVGLFRRQRPVVPDEVRDILLIRTAYIGDVVMTIPLLKPLRRLYPRAKITFLTNRPSGELLRNHPAIDRVITYDAFWFYERTGRTAFSEYLNVLEAVRKTRYDLVVEARGDIRDIFLLAFLGRNKRRVGYGIGGGRYLLTDIVPFTSVKHRVEYHRDIARFLGTCDEDVAWDCHLSAAEENRADDILKENGVDPHKQFITMQPGARKPLKRWPVERFAAAADALTRHYGVPLVITGSAGERALAGHMVAAMQTKPVVLAGKISLRQLAAVLRRSLFFVCNDSAPLHIASMMKTPTVAVFGPSKSRETGPYGNPHRVVERDFPCRVTCDEDVCCFHSHHACMKAIGTEDVVAAAGSLYKDSHG